MNMDFKDKVYSKYDLTIDSVQFLDLQLLYEIWRKMRFLD